MFPFQKSPVSLCFFCPKNWPSGPSAPSRAAAPPPTRLQPARGTASRAPHGQSPSSAVAPVGRGWTLGADPSFPIVESTSRTYAYIICYMLYAICYMLYAICYMLYAICYMLYAICYMLYAICYMHLYAICYMLYAICYMCMCLLYMI